MSHFKAAVFFVFVFCSAIYFFSGVGLQNSGDAPQYALTQSLVERKSFYLANDAEWVWPDIGKLNGHTISGRSPGESFLNMPFYWIATHLTQFIALPYDGNREGISFSSGIEVVASIGVAFFGGLSVVMVIYLARFFTTQPLAQIGAGLSFGLGSLLWKYATSFYRHSYHTFFVLLATYGLFLGLTQPKYRWQASILIGFGAGGALFVEPTSLVFVMACLGLWGVVLWQQNKLLLKESLQMLGVTTALIGLINLPIFYYNQILFGAFYKNGWEYQVRNTWLGDHSVAFSSPLLPSIASNLFSPNIPLSPLALSPKLVGSTIGVEQSYEYALRYPYKGVFIQSPYLFSILIAWFWLSGHRKKLLAYSTLLAFAANVIPFMYLVYYSPNSYDTRFFITFAALLSPAFGVVLDRMLQHKMKYWAIGMVVITLLISGFNAWVSNLENYAPHLTGEKRVTLNEVLNQRSLFTTLKETFPNSANYPVFFGYVLILGLGYAAVEFLRTKHLKSSDS